MGHRGIGSIDSHQIGVDPDLIEAARGMGMRPGQILRRVQLPLAMRTIMAGIRTATADNPLSHDNLGVSLVVNPVPPPANTFQDCR